MQELLSAIAEADSAQLSELILALSRRYRQLYPEWEILFLSFPRDDPEEQRRILNTIQHYIK